MRKFLFINLIFLFIISCKQEKCFQNLVFFDSSKGETEFLNGELIHFDDIYTGDMFVFDSLFVFYSYKYPDYLLSSFRLDGKHIQNCVSKGKGPDEFVGLNIFNQILLDKDSVAKFWSYAFNEQKIVELNCDKLFTGEKDVIDSIIPFSWANTHAAPFNYIFRLNDTHVLVKTHLESLFVSGTDVELPKYQIVNIRDGHVLHEFTLYENPIPYKKNEKSPSIYNMLYSTTDQIKPDLKKVVSAMGFLHQINILDLESGIYTSFRSYNTPEFSDLIDKDYNELNLYYKSTCVDNDFIYTLFINKPMDMKNLPSSNEIHVFDWDGNFIKRFILDQHIDQIRIDLANHILYGKKEITDQVYSFKMD